MIVDVTGTILIPGNGGKDCPGNGSNPLVECCCEECDYLLCCFSTCDSLRCSSCKNPDCPHAGTTAR